MATETLQILNSTGQNIGTVDFNDTDGDGVFDTGETLGTPSYTAGHDASQAAFLQRTGGSRSDRIAWTTGSTPDIGTRMYQDPHTGNPISIRVGSGSWLQINGDDNNTVSSPAEGRRLIDRLGANPGSMSDSVEIRYGAGRPTTGRDRITLGELYDRSGVARPGGTEGTGTATVRYRTSRRGAWQTDTITYRTEPGTDGRVNHVEATRIREALRARRRDAGNGRDWQQIQIRAEGENLTTGGLDDRVRIGATPDENELANNTATNSVTQSLEQQKEELTARLGRLKQMFQQLLFFLQQSGFDMQTLIRVKRVMNSIMQVQTSIASVHTVEQMIGIQERMDQLTTEITNLSSGDDGYAAQLQGKTAAQQQLQGQLSAITSYMRQVKAFMDEGVADLKSLQDSTHSRQVGNASWRD